MLASVQRMDLGDSDKACIPVVSSELIDANVQRFFLIFANRMAC